MRRKLTILLLAIASNPTAANEVFIIGDNGPLGSGMLAFKDGGYEEGPHSVPDPVPEPRPSTWCQIWSIILVVSLASKAGHLTWRL